MELAVIRLKESRETIQQWLREYRSIRCREYDDGKSLVLVGEQRVHKPNTTPDLSVLIGSDTPAGFKVAAAMGELVRVLPHLVNQPTQLVTTEFQRFFDACGRFSNGIGSTRIAANLGAFTASQFDDSEFSHLWKSAIIAIESDVQPTVKARQFPLYLLRGRTIVLAKRDWALTEPLRKRLPAVFAQVQESANKVSENTLRAGVRHLVPGESQFPEDRLFAALGSEAMSSIEDGIGWSPQPIHYGTLRGETRNVDFAMTNELFLEPEERKSLEAIFGHLGYFAFVSRRWLEQELVPSAGGRTLNVKQRQVLSSILNPDSPPKPAKLELPARAWVALQAQLPVYQNSEYREMTDRLTESAMKFAPLTTEVCLSQKDAFDDDFEAFVCGKQDAFIGGSIHARLLKRWFMPHGRFVEILRPADFSVLLSDIWPPQNRLRFGNRLQGSRKLRASIVRLYLDIAALLDVVATAPPEDENCRAVLHHLMSILALSQEGRHESRWSFVTDEQDMKAILTVDNTFGATANRTRSRRHS